MKKLNDFIKTSYWDYKISWTMNPIITAFATAMVVAFVASIAVIFGA